MTTLRMDNDFRINLMRPFGITAPGHERIKAAKLFAAQKGFSGARGGWIYDAKGVPVCQGWDNFYWQYRAQIRDTMTRLLTAFESFKDMVNTAPTYRPTILPRTWREVYLADEYDTWMSAARDERRAYVGFDRYDRRLWELMNRAIAAR